MVRIRRLRSLGLSLEQIAKNLSNDGSNPDDLTATLRALATDLEQEIERLRELRARVLKLASSATPYEPTEAWRGELQRHGLLEEAAALPAGERAAAALLDALHPDGIGGVIAQARPLPSDASLVDRLGRLLYRFRALPGDAGDDAIEALAADYAAAVPRPTESAPAIDLETMDKLIGGRFSAAQRRCLRRIRELLEAGGE